MNLFLPLFFFFFSSAGLCADFQDLAGDWHCRRDASGAGVAEGWYRPPFDESWLGAREAGGCAGPGSAGAAGYAWWRCRVSVPDGWRGRKVFLEYGPGAPAAAWVDGTPAVVSPVPKTWISAIDVSGLSGPGPHDLVILESGGRTAAGKPGGGIARLCADSSKARVVDASDSWRVRADPANAGAGKGWYGAGVKDSEWLLLSRTIPGETSEGTKLKGRVVWYRRWVDLPEDWDRVFVMMSGFPGGADLYVNGYIVGRDLAVPSRRSGLIVSEATRAARGKRRFLVSVRVSRDPGRADSPAGRGGIRFYLVRSPASVFGDPAGRFEGLAAENPSLPWSAWSGEGNEGWILIGSPKTGGRAFVGTRGRMAAEGSIFALSFWAHEKASGRTVFSESVPCSAGLDGKFLPMARITADGGRIKVHMLFWVHPDEPVPGAGVAFAEAVLQNESDRTRELDLLVAVHPFPPFPGGPGRDGRFFLDRLEWLPEIHAIAVNGRPSIILSEAPDAFGATAFNGTETIADYVARGELPETEGAVTDPVHGLASGAAIYRLTIPPYSSRSKIVRVVIPRADIALTREEVRLISAVSARPSVKECAEGWYASLMRPGGFSCRIPGRYVQDSIWASLSHLLVMTASGDPFSLPEYAGRDSRDDIFPITAALLRTGQQERAKDFVRRLKAAYRGRDSAPMDAGADRIACAAVECYRFTKDSVFLKEFYRDIRDACAGIRDARERFLSPGFRGTALEGVMPPRRRMGSEGPVYCYDDCYWALKCVRDAAEAARALGLKKDEEKAEELAGALRDSIGKSISLRMRAASIDWIPYGPLGEGCLADPCYSVLGNQGASWPCGFSGPDGDGAGASGGDAWSRCFVPFGNGYFSGEAFHPSVGMSVVHGYLLEGRNECAWDFIKWALENMAVPGTFSWPYRFDRAGQGPSDAAGRDLRASAEWIGLFRDMLVREEKGALHLLPGAPYDWVKYRRHVEVRGLPTLYGEIGFRTKAAVRWLTLEITENASPPAGYLWRIPGQRRIGRIDVDKARLSEIPPSRVLALPAGTREVNVYW